MIRDGPEEELIEELALISEIRNVLKNILKEAKGQQVRLIQHFFEEIFIYFFTTFEQIVNRAARERLEYDWSDKKDAFEIDTLNSALNNKSTTVLFKPGATRYMNESVALVWLGLS